MNAGLDVFLSAWGHWRSGWAEARRRSVSESGKLKGRPEAD